jgi:hypothetical protein
MRLAPALAPALILLVVTILFMVKRAAALCTPVEVFCGSDTGAARRNASSNVLQTKITHSPSDWRVCFQFPNNKQKGTCSRLRAARAHITLLRVLE